MMISEDLKSKYDVIGQKSGSKIVVAHESGSTGMKSSYDSSKEFMEDVNKNSIKGVILESVNG